MGRNRKYFTDEEQRKAKQKDNKLYYQRHKKSILKRRMHRYNKALS